MNPTRRSEARERRRQVIREIGSARGQVWLMKAIFGVDAEVRGQARLSELKLAHRLLSEEIVCKL